MKYIIFAILLFAFSPSYSQTKEHIWEVGINNSWVRGTFFNNSTGQALGAFVSHNMTVFGKPDWLLTNELGFEKMITGPDQNQPLFWYENALRYRPVIARKFHYLAHHFSVGLGSSFMYGTQLTGGVKVNGVYTILNYQRELSYGPSVSLSYKNKKISDRFGVRFDYTRYGRLHKARSFSLLYKIGSP